MTTHEKLSPSGRHRWGKCAQAPRQEAKYPEPPSNPAAADGTHTHTGLEKCLKDGIPAAFLEGMTLKDHEGEFVVDRNRAERIQFALDYIWSRGGKIISEQKVDPQFLIGRSDLGGTVDVQVVGDDWIEIIDYKDGMAAVSAKDNPQLELYGFGALTPFYKAGTHSKFKTIRLTIIQPKLRAKGLSGIESHEMTMDEFIPKWEQIKKEADATDDPNAPFNPGEDQCKYCKHAGACTARAEAAMKSAQIAFAVVGETLDVAQQAADKEPSTMTDDQLREIILGAPLIRQMLEKAEEEALRRLKAGQVIPGLKTVRGRGTRAWAYTETEMAEKLKKFGIPKADLFVTKLISPAQAEKLTWEKKGAKVQLTERQLKLMATEYIKKSEGELKVVAEADDRPAVESAASLFSPVLPSFLS